MRKYALSVIGLLLLTYISPQISVAQKEGTITVRKADFRGERPQKAFIAATSASEKDVVIVMVEGAGENLIQRVENNIKGLIRNGFERVGLIISDNLPENKTPMIVILSQGWTYAVMKDAKADIYMDADFYKLIRDAYNEDIVPKLNRGF